MKKDVPKKFLDEYETRRNEFQDTLKRIISLLKRRLGQLAARTGVRGRITKPRIKRPAKVWENATKAGLTAVEAFTRVEDIIGIRIVCNNLSDIPPIVEMIRTDCSILNVIDVKDMVSSPLNNGYRAFHVRAEFSDFFDRDKKKIPCEIQIRTLAQDTWARLSRADLYGKDVPPSIRTLAHALSTQLSAIDEIGQLIRDELNQCPPVAEEIKDTDYITPQRLALLYKHKFGEDIYEWSLIDWVKHLEEAEANTIGDVCGLLEDTKMRATINKISNRIRGFDLEDLEWAVYSALVASESSAHQGVRAVQSRIQDEWDEIVTTARSEALSEMPETLEEFAEMLEAGSVPVWALKELGGIQSCYRCGTDILRPEQAAEAVLDYYGNPDTELDLKSLFEQVDSVDVPEVESVDYSGVCQYCGYQMSKDD
jgi:ppGpp synthetase/RelA/SpoT-type nucleotidyltranferase